MNFRLALRCKLLFVQAYYQFFGEVIFHLADLSEISLDT